MKAMPSTDAKAEAQLELPEMLRMGGDQERAAEQQQPERIDAARPGAVEQPADQRRGEAAGQRGQRIDRDDLGAVPAETLRDRLQEDGKTLAEAAAEHRQRKTQRQHVERHARRLRRRRQRSSARRVLDPSRAQGARFRVPRARVKSECAYAGLSRTWRFLPSDSLITPSGVRSVGLQHHLLVGDRDVVDAQAAALDLAPRLAIRGDKAGLDEGSASTPSSGFEFAARKFPPSAGFRRSRLPRKFAARFRTRRWRHRGRAAARSRQSPAPSWPR